MEARSAIVRANVGEEAQDQLMHRVTEGLSELAEALAELPAGQARLDESNRSLTEVNGTLRQAVVTLTELGKSTLTWEQQLEATAGKLAAATERAAVRQEQLLAALESQMKRFSMLLLWGVVFSAFAVAATATSVALLLFRPR